MKYICKTKCFVKKRLYEVGEILTSPALPCKHFEHITEKEEAKLEVEKKEKKAKAKKAEQKTFKDIQASEKEALILGKKR